MEHIDSLLGVACSVSSQIGKKESSHSALNSLQLADDEDVSAVADVKSIASDTATTIFNSSDLFVHSDSGNGFNPGDMSVVAGDGMPSIKCHPEKRLDG